MQLTEQHIIGRDDPRYAVIDAAAFQSKNLYNAALYVVRQSFIFEGKYLSYNQMDKLMKSHEAYKALPSNLEAREQYGSDQQSKFCVHSACTLD
jgi:hypothetical protein